MKDLILPKSEKNQITLGELDQYYNGLIIGYRNDKAIGYIQYYESDCTFSNDASDYGDTIDRDENLLNLLTRLVKEGTCTHFKVLDFES